MPQNDLQNVKIPYWGYKSWGEMFSNRQLLSIQTFIRLLGQLKREWGGEGFALNLTDYHRALLTYLGIWIDRIAVVNTSFGRWHSGRETLEHPFSRQAIFCLSTGSAKNNLEWVIRYINQVKRIKMYNDLDWKNTISALESFAVGFFCKKVRLEYTRFTKLIPI